MNINNRNKDNPTTNTNHNHHLHSLNNITIPNNPQQLHR
jgi:hypothetical protein